MTFWGFAINYLIRMNINIAIVSMVIKNPIKNINKTITNECPTNHVTFTADNTSVQTSAADLNVNIIVFIFQL